MTQELNAERILLTKIIQASGSEYGDIEEEIQKLIGEPAHKIVLDAMEEYAKCYATACVKASLEKAAENAKYKIDEWAQGGAYIEKESIDNPDNIVLL